MTSFAALIARSNEVIRDRFSDCTVTIASSAAWPVDPLQGDEPRSDDGDIVLRGSYNEPYIEDLDREGYQPSVSIPTIVDAEVRQWQSTYLKHKTRVLVDRDAPANTVRMVHRIERIQHDGQGRTLLYLHAIGPLCADVEAGPQGYAHTFPVAYGSAIYHRCAQLYEP